MLSILLCSWTVSGQDIDFSYIQLWDVQKENIVPIPIDQTITVLIFTGTDCPYDKRYKSRITALKQQYGDQADFILINAHTPHQNKDNATQTKTQAAKYNMPYFLDLNQEAMKLFQIEKSPEVAIIWYQNGKHSLVYHGAIDDSPQSSSDVHTHYVQDVLNNLIKGRPSPHEFNRAAGCRIR